MTITYADRLRAAAALLEEHQLVDVHIGVYDHVDDLAVHFRNSDSDALRLGDALRADVFRTAEFDGQTWASIEGGTYRGLPVLVTGPQRPMTFTSGLDEHYETVRDSVPTDVDHIDPASAA